MKWAIIHIPEKPQISITEPPSVDVFAAVIEPKLANTLVRRLNKICPLENLTHVKRVRRSSLEGGKIQLSVVLCLSHGEVEQLESIQSDILELVHAYQLSPFIAKVAKYAASSNEEWKEQCKLWPTSYHPPTYNIDGITGFSEEDSQTIFNFMKLALKLTKSGPQLENAAVIVDPSVRQIISSASDQTHSWHSLIDTTSMETGCIKQPAVFTCSQPDANAAAVRDTLLSDGVSDENKRSYTGVSCLYPRKWMEHQQNTGNTCYFHPLRHAALVAVELAAARDKHLFPGSGNMLDCSFQENRLTSSMNSPAKKQKLNLSKDEDDLDLKACSHDSCFETERPYLCTGFDIYLVWEPCAMCAMALVHQRIRRIFFAFPNPNFGALGSVQRLQGERSLNHHYAVFRVLLPEDVFDNVHS
ncbi:hypothetical protein AQUCO_00900252v1 [Aquilegia coerulea]|uniref:CMP/dCMP-type deaminase domain-containing protein n=1 Tax=Aquilegia coerulea TaxID=218851 RepID=A0A2G5ECQ5_AQUCA|nr:hypothetical protein AQUCO_00900252v1 [Aquilegia coerulea]